MKRSLGLAAVAVLAVSACGDSGSVTVVTAAPPVTASTTTSTTSTTTTATTLPTTTTTATTTAPTTTAPWIGEPFDFWVPVPTEGAIIGVIGVETDDTLNVRSGPGISFPSIAVLQPTAMGIRGTGSGWQLPSGSVWWEIETSGGVGWANQRFLSRFAGVNDVTSSVVASLGEIPQAETMLELGTIVATELSYVDDDFSSRLVVVDGQTVGDLGEITIDVLGLADDSVEGFRLRIFGQPLDSGEGFSLASVESTTLCQRGVSGELCV